MLKQSKSSWPIFASVCCLSALVAFLNVSQVPADPLQAGLVDHFPQAVLPTSQGEQVELRSLRGKRATVLVSLSIECPLSNGYVPTLQKLHDEFATEGVSLIALNANDGQSLKQMSQHQKEYQFQFPLLKDPGAQVTHALGLTHCPEVCVVDAVGQVRYMGRIDDRYSRRGGAPGQIRNHDLKQALGQLLAGNEITVTKTEAIGCPIYLAVNRREEATPLDRSSSNAKAPSVTYSQEISRIIQSRCQECHRPGGVGPFAMENYDDALSWAADIAAFTKNRTMPPWKPAAGYGDFHNARAIPQHEIDQIQQWVKAGCPEGDVKNLPAPIVFSDSWKMGPPDVILTAQSDYQVGPDGIDEYRCFVLPTNFDGDRYVTALEVLPGNQRVVHHVIAFVDTTGRSNTLDAADPKEGYSTSAGFPGFFPSGGLGGWAPGNQGHELPPGMAKVLPRGANVVMQVHYHRTGKPETDRTQLGLYFAKPPITRAVRTIPVMPFGGPWSGMKIPAGADNHEVRASLVLPADVLAVTITPHMHLLGKDMRVTATLPDGTLQPLIDLQYWDFNWQESYQYREPVRLPKGTRIEVVAHFDNSAKNPHNPSQPPKTVHWGEQTNDEMCIAFIEVVPVAEAQSLADVRAPTPGGLLKDLLRSQLPSFLSRTKRP